MLDALIPHIPDDVSPIAYYLLVGAGVIVIGIAKGGFGGGIGLLAVPLMALGIGDPYRMLGVMLPTLILADILSNLHYLKDYDWPLLRPMVLGAVVGVAAASFALAALQGAPPELADRGLKLLVGLICLAFVGVQVWRLAGRPAPRLPLHPASGASVGFAAGFVSTFSHSAGPIAALYLLHVDKPKRVIVACLLLLFLAINLLKVPAYVGLGVIHAGTLRDMVWFLPLIPIGTLLGVWLHKRVNEKIFLVIMYVAAAVASVLLIYRALAPQAAS